MKTIRGRQRGAKRRALRRARVSGPVVRIGKPDASLTGLAGLVTVDELAVRLGIVAELDQAIGPVKQRDRGHTAGQLLVGMATGLLAGQDLKLTRLGGHCVAAEVVIMSRVEQLVERDHLLAVGVVPAGAQAGAEGVAVGAALLTEVEAVAVGALVDDLVADEGAGLS